MLIVSASAVIESDIDGPRTIRSIERAGRTCYKSEERITDSSAAVFVKGILKRGHLSVIEHESMTVRFVCDRGVSHEIVRHRIASYSQESTRYCNYSKQKFGKELTFIEPPGLTGNQRDAWLRAMIQAELLYFEMLDLLAAPQIARSVLPNSLKTEIVMTANLREWRHFFFLRCAKAAHPQMRELAIPLLKDFQQAVPVVFEDIEY